MSMDFVSTASVSTAFGAIGFYSFRTYVPFLILLLSALLFSVSGHTDVQLISDGGGVVIPPAKFPTSMQGPGFSDDMPEPADIPAGLQDRNHSSPTYELVLEFNVRKAMGIVSYPGSAGTQGAGGVKRSPSISSLLNRSASTENLAISQSFCGASSDVQGSQITRGSLNVKVPRVEYAPRSMLANALFSAGVLPGPDDNPDEFLKMVLPGISDSEISKITPKDWMAFASTYRMNLATFTDKNTDAFIPLSKSGEGAAADDGSLILNTRLFQFIERIRQIISGADGKRIYGMIGFRRQMMTMIDKEGKAINPFLYERETVLVQKATSAAIKLLGFDPKKDGPRFFFLRPVGQAPGEFDIATEPPRDPALEFFSLEVPLLFLFNRIPEATNYTELLNILAEFGIIYNWIRPFEYCNETTLANIFNFVFLLYQGPGDGKTFGLNALQFKSLDELATLSLDEMLRTLLAAATYVQPFDAGHNTQGYRQKEHRRTSSYSGSMLAIPESTQSQSDEATGGQEQQEQQEESKIYDGIETETETTEDGKTVVIDHV